VKVNTGLCGRLCHEHTNMTGRPRTQCAMSIAVDWLGTRSVLQTPATLQRHPS
jgi:hypothetical protein